jgi:hypothetical protein
MYSLAAAKLLSKEFDAPEAGILNYVSIEAVPEVRNPFSRRCFAPSFYRPAPQSPAACRSGQYVTFSIGRLDGAREYRLNVRRMC